MKIYLDCIPCFVRQCLDAARNATNDVKTHERIIRDVLRLTAGLDLNLPPPWVGQTIHRLLRNLTGVEDPYRPLKHRFNQLAMGWLSELRPELEKAEDPLAAAVKIAIAANIIDLGAKSDLSEDQAYKALRESWNASVHGDWQEFRKRAAEAREILYLADNAGEIVMDRLLIETLGPERITLAVRGAPVMNDATLTDAREVRLCDIVEVIDNGSDAPGTILDDCSAAFRDRFHGADLIIAKGQGNYETLSEVDADISFLFKVKCPVIADHVGLPTGTHALLSAKRKNSRARNRLV